MLERLVSRDVLVTCECGHEWPVANPDLEESIQCGVCGRQIRLKERNVRARAAAKPSALMHAMANSDPQYRINEGVRLVREGKYPEAADFYRSVVTQELIHRDAFYGLGYCYFRMGRYEESYAMLGIAVEMGHPTAEHLLKKVREHLGLTGLPG